MKRIIDYFIHNSFIVNLISGFVIIVGCLSISLMSRDIIPPLQWPMVNVKVSLFGGTPDEIEKFVTFPIEENLKNITGVKKITSTSSNSYARIRVLFKSDYTEIDKATEEIKSQIDGLRSRLPENIRNISVQRAEKRDNFLYWLGIENLNESQSEQRAELEKFEENLLKIPGVVNFNSNFRNRDIYIQFNKDKMVQFELSVSSVRRQLRNALRMSPVGALNKGAETIEVKLSEMANDLESINNLTIRQNSNGDRIRLKDIALVSYKLADTKKGYRINGLPGLSVGIRKNLSSDSIDLKEKVDAKIKVQNEKEGSFKVRAFLDGPHFIKTQINVLTKNGLFGFILVFILLVLFLNFKTALMTSIGLPLAYFGTFIVLYAFGLNIDLLSIIGMILVVGVLVDDAIIVAEKYNDNLRSGLKPKEAARNAVRSLMVPVTGTVLTTLVAFLPLILIKSEISALLFAVPIVVIASLVISWIESFFILPNHLAHFAKSPAPARAEEFMLKLRFGYEFLLQWTLKLRYLALTVLVVCVGLAGFLISKKIKKNFNLNISPEFIAVKGELKTSQSIADSIEQLKKIETQFLAYDKKEISSTLLEVGNIWRDGKMQTSPRFFQFSLFPVKKDSYPTRQINKIKPDLQKIIDNHKTRFKNIKITSFGQGQNEQKKDILTVYMSGSETVDYFDIESELVKASQSMKSIDSYSSKDNVFQESWEFSPNHQKLSLYKLSPAEVATQIKSYFTPDHLIETRINGENIWVFTEMLEKDNLNYEQLNQLTVLTQKSVAIPLDYIGVWKKTKSLKSIQHKNGQRQFSFDFNVSSTSNRAEAKKEFSKLIKEVQAKHPTQTFQLEYLSDEEQSNQAWAFKVAVICVLGVFFILAIILKSLTQPLLVSLPIPFGIVGIVFSLYAHKAPMGLMALVGLIGTIGVSVNASIILVDKINKLTAITGEVSRKVIIDACSSRLRAILLTTATTLLGVFPMAYSFGGESGFTQPLAFSMAWGLTFATFLTLFILPSLLEIREDIFNLANRCKKWFSIKALSEVKEPAQKPRPYNETSL